MPSALGQRLSRLTLFALLSLSALTGCSYFRQKAADRYVYVTTRQVFLRDRNAAVSNRTGAAVNGEKLAVLDRSRRAIKVRTPRGEVGWVEEKYTADQHTADQFAALYTEHRNDPVVATASAREEVYLHVAPGRETARFYLLAEAETLSLLERATVPKVAPAGSVPARPPAPPPASGTQDADTAPAPPPIMEDWWLARNAKGQTGWILSAKLDVSVPDALTRYAEGQRIVGAYVLTTVDDPQSGIVDNGNPVTRIPEYVAFLSPYKAGLPYDFDQVRVYIWNLKKHRYETGFREHGVVGYLPAVIAAQKDPYSAAAQAQLTLPGFTYHVLPAEADIPIPDPVTGIVKPERLIDKTYRLVGNICLRVQPPGQPTPAEAHPVLDAPKNKSGKGHKKHK